MSFRILLSSFQKEIFFLFLSLTNAVQPQNPFMECCPTTVHSVKAHSVFSDKYQHSYFYAFNTTPICVPASWRFVKWERSSRNSSLLFTSCRKELQEGEEVEKPSYASVFLQVKYQQPLENRNKTSTLLHTTDCKGKKQKHTRELCTGRSILFQDLNAMLLQGKTGAKKHPTHMEGAERNRTKTFQHPHLQCISFQRSTWTHTHTIKTSTFHQKTKCKLQKHTCSTTHTH